jgi:hypothetical protein
MTQLTTTIAEEITVVFSEVRMFDFDFIVFLSIDISLTSCLLRLRRHHGRLLRHHHG